MKEIPKKELGTGRVAFKARLEEIKKEIEAGRTVMSVYREYGQKVGIGYSQFDRYVNKFIRRKPEEKPSVLPEPKVVEKELSTSEYLRTRPNKKEIL